MFAVNRTSSNVCWKGTTSTNFQDVVRHIYLLLRVSRGIENLRTVFLLVSDDVDQTRVFNYNFGVSWWIW